jgi:hypothetical protein
METSSDRSQRPMRDPPAALAGAQRVVMNYRALY